MTPPPSHDGGYVEEPSSLSGAGSARGGAKNFVPFAVFCGIYSGVSSEAREVEVEVLPAPSGREQELSRILAWLLDDLIPVPGTKYRVGLDPLIGLIPGLGDTSTAAAACLILLEGFRSGVPRVVLVRMTVNLLINALIGSLPGVGDLFSAYFKSNRRNYELLRRHAGAKGASTTSDWIFLIAVFGSVTLSVLAIAFASAYVAFRLLGALWTF